MVERKRGYWEVRLLRSLPRSRSRGEEARGGEISPIFTSSKKFTSSKVEKKELLFEEKSLYFEKTTNHHSHFSTKRSAWRNLLRTIKASSGYTFGET